MDSAIEKPKAPPAMFTRDVADKVSDKLGVVKKHCRPLAAAFTEAIYEQLAAGGRVTLRGLGTFILRVRKERTSYNPQDRSQKFLVPAHNVVVFVPCNELKSDVLKLPPGIFEKGKSGFDGKRPYEKRMAKAQIASSSSE